MEVTDVDKLPYASSLCGACRDACPVQIDLPRMLLELRRDVVEAEGATLFDRAAMQGFSKMMQSRSSYESAGKLGSLASNVLARLSGGNLTFLPGPLSPWTASRDLPPLARHSFREQWQQRRAARKQIV
jgi:L-lactate dehydrogenase complex protein LldF